MTSILSIIHKYDLAILYFINNHCRCPILDKAMPMITSLGNKAFIWIVIAIILMFNKKYRNAGIMVICAMLLGSLLGDCIIKNAIHRARPYEHLSTIKLLIAKQLTYSFPSGHTVYSFAAFGILMKKLPKYRFYALAMALIIAFSRMYLFVHYPTDILGGIIVGLLSAWIVLKVNEHFFTN